VISKVHPFHLYRPAVILWLVGYEARARITALHRVPLLLVLGPGRTHSVKFTYTTTLFPLTRSVGESGQLTVSSDQNRDIDIPFRLSDGTAQSLRT